MTMSQLSIARIPLRAEGHAERSLLGKAMGAALPEAFPAHLAG
jgi:hypothetical protein